MGSLNSLARLAPIQYKIKGGLLALCVMLRLLLWEGQLGIAAYHLTRLPAMSLEEMLPEHLPHTLLSRILNAGRMFLQGT